MKKKFGVFRWIFTVYFTVLFLNGCYTAPQNEINSAQDQTAMVSQTEQGKDSETNSEQADSQIAAESEINAESDFTVAAEIKKSAAAEFSFESVPAFTTEPYVIVNDNVPYFTDDELVTTSFENYSDLDSMGRCGAAYANVCTELMPTQERGEIGSVKPSGWQTVKYDIVSGKYLYNRCHLIGYQLSAENANTKNLITGTRYLNVEGMLPFENMVADYVKDTGNHVLYRVTPVFEGNNLVASGVRMEAKSVEDAGAGILFHVYCYNNQPGIIIDYATGESHQDPDYAGGMAVSEGIQAESYSTSDKAVTEGSNNNSDSADTAVETPVPASQDSTIMVHITDTGSKYHSAGCRYLKKSDREVTLQEAKNAGLSPCSQCSPPQ